MIHCARGMKGIAAAAVMAANAASAATVPVDPISHYGREMLFEVRLDGRPIGRHRVTFEEDGEEGLKVRARSDLKVKLLGITVYRFTYQSDSLWRGGQLVELTARTNDDGKVTEITAEDTGSGFVIDGPRGVIETSGDLLPSDHWNPLALEGDRLLNTLTGSINQVTVRDLGPDVIEAEGVEYAARRYAYEGDLKAEVWYDDAGRWLRLSFERANGSVVDYVCEVCGIAPLSEAKADEQATAPDG